jgi:hypothetical protein
LLKAHSLEKLPFLPDGTLFRENRAGFPAFARKFSVFPQKKKECVTIDTHSFAIPLFSSQHQLASFG